MAFVAVSVVLGASRICKLVVYSIKLSRTAFIALFLSE